MVKIRLRRMGAKKEPYYRIVVADSRFPRDGRCIEEIGTYDPKNEANAITIDSDKAKQWIKNGAQPSGVLEHPGVMKDPNRVRDNWEAAYGGAANAHRVAVLEEGMTYKPVSLPPEDSQFLES